MKKTYLTTLSLFGALLSASAQTQFYDFDSYTHVNISSITDLTHNGSASFDGAPEVAGGLDDNFGNPSGSLRANGTSFSVVTNDGAVSFDTSGDISFTQSIYFKTLSDFSALTANNQDAVMLGLTDQSSQSTPSSLQGFTAEFVNATIRVSNSSTGAFQFLNAASSDSPNLTFGASGSLVAGSWHLFTATFAYDSGSGNWSITSSVDLTDDEGVVISNIVSDTETITNSGLFGNGAELRGFFASENAGVAGLDQFDNATLVAVPETSVSGLVSGFLALGWIVVARRK